MERPTRPQFLFSILTALVTGVGTAYIGIMAVELVQRPNLVGGVMNSAGAVVSTVQAGVRDFTLRELISKNFAYQAEAIEEDVGDDITFRGESLSAASVDSSGAAISALAYSVQSLDKDNVLLEKNSDRALPIASVTKLITAAVARKVFDEDDTIEITSRVLTTEGNSGKLRAGEKYKVKELLYPLLMVSSNDAAEAIAQAYDREKGRGEFVKAMNNWTQDIGAYQTYFRDASGLSPQNVSTARDLSIIAKWIKENDPEIFDITLTKAKTVRSRTWVNPTHFLSLSSYNGGKNGFTTEAKLTNVSLFSLGSPKRYYSVVLLGSSARDKDTLTVLNKAVK